MSDRNPAPDPAEPLFSAVLRPYRSLSPRGFAMLLVFIGATCFAGGLMFWSMGAWPITGFFGLDLLAIQLAFRLNYRAARSCEVVEITASDLVIRRIAANGRAREYHFNPYWARLIIEKHPEWGITRLTVTSHGESLDIGAFLPPAERESFAAAFGAALRSARSGA